MSIKILPIFSFNKSETHIFLVVLNSLHSLDLVRLTWDIVIEALHLFSK